MKREELRRSSLLEARALGKTQREGLEPVDNRSFDES